MSPRISRTLLSIVANLNNAIGPLNFLTLQIPIVLFQRLWRLFITGQLLFVSLSPSCSTVFPNLWQDQSIILSLRFLYYHLIVFLTSICWWFFTGGWVAASLFKSGQSQQCGNLDGLHASSYFQVFSLSILWWLYRAHQLHLVSPSLSCSIVFSVI